MSINYILLLASHAYLEIFFLHIYRYKCIHTVLSSPRVIIITKKMMAKKVDPTIFAMASGYVMKSRLGPRGGAEGLR